MYCQGALNPSVVDLRLWDISLVLITQIGLVTIVEQAPAVKEAYPRANHQFSNHKKGSTSQLLFFESHQSIYPSLATPTLTCLFVEVFTRSVVNSQIDSPGWQIAQQHRAESLIETSYPIFFPDRPPCAKHAAV